MVMERFYFARTQSRPRHRVPVAWSASAAAQWIGRFHGYASVFNALVETVPPTRILRGAFRASLADRVQHDRIRLLWQHDVCDPIGVPLDLEEDPRGLLLFGVLADTSRGREALALLEAGVVRELSIGFDPVRWDMVDEPGQSHPVRLVHEVRLWEVSLVTFAADKQARILRVEREPDVIDDAEPATDPRLARVNAELATYDREARMRREFDRARLAFVEAELAKMA
jgi:HK97 family phage prohead protease